jgi:predicted GNAT family acetyltransferase
VSERPQVRVVDNAAKHRYEAYVDGDPVGFLYYREGDEGLVLVHTEVDEEFEGRGVGGQLVAGALEHVRKRGLSVTPVCPFATSYIERHPEYADLVAA